LTLTLSRRALQEKLGVVLEKEDEMECLVSGCNFFLKAIRHEAFTFEGGQPNYIASNGGALPLSGAHQPSLQHLGGSILSRAGSIAVVRRSQRIF